MNKTFWKELETLPKASLLDEKKKGNIIDLQFQLEPVGRGNEIEIIPDLEPFDFHNSPKIPSWFPFFLDPKTSNPISTLATNYLDPRCFLPSLEECQEYWPRDLSYFSQSNPNNWGFNSIEPSESRTTLELERDHSGKIIGWKEISLHENILRNAQNSTSLLRQPGSKDDFSRGNTENYPFLPGGIQIDHHSHQYKYQEIESDFNSEAILSTPPGFNEPITFTSTVKLDVLEKELDQLPKHKKYQNVSLAVTNSTAIDEYALKEQAMIVQTTRSSKKKQLLNFKDVFKEDIESVIYNETEGIKADENSKEETMETIETKEIKEGNIVPNKLERKESIDDLLFDHEVDIITLLQKQKRSQPKKNNDRDWAIQANMDMSNFSELVPQMALEYPFELDQFQKEAIYHLENGESVFVAAHTSAGKTVVAEYAIALSAKHMTRTIYTSPIKALSNQKFRDFKNTFGNVGLITGDVSINPEASCLIVTTEILRSMLYRGADIIRDVEWVIFDEVHYINDLERGVVWEEVIIMLPAHINLILLSATIPNTFEFANWIGRTKQKNIYIISTNKRPIPLEHHLWTGTELHKIVDSKSNFLEGGYKAAFSESNEKKAKSKKGTGVSNTSGNYKQEQAEWPKLINFLRSKSLLPVVVFAFSKKKCEECAYGLTNIDLTTGSEKSQIHVLIEDSLSRLKGTDRKLPQVLRIKDLLKRGIGIHHGGLLPIIKEIVEILFSRGLIKVLFATETFAMGVNMPARTVVFNSISKHDGRNFRELLTGEYIQMSGRAGRRGLDTVGTVIIIAWGDVPLSANLKTMILGKATKLESQFRLTYNMILNLLRVEDFKVEDMLKRSFAEFFSQHLQPEQQELLIKTEKQLSKLEKIECIMGEPDIENYHSIYSEISSINKQLMTMLLNSKNSSQILSSGRVLILKTQKYGSTIGVLLKIATTASKSHLSSADQVTSFSVFIMCDKTSPKPNQISIMRGKDYEVVTVPAENILHICVPKLKVDPSKLMSSKLDSGTASSVIQQLDSFLNESPLGPKEIDPIREAKINDLDFVELHSKKKKLIQAMNQSKCQKCPKLPYQFELMDKYSKLNKLQKNLKYALSDENLDLMPEFQQRLTVLKKLNYIDQENTVLLKGRVARELNTVSDELIATELIFENVLTPLTPSEIVALLSSLIFQEKTDTEPVLTENLENSRDQLIQIATQLATVQIECGLPITTADYLLNINHKMMEVVYEWARQMPFYDICQLTTAAEGSIVRCITRLDETCKEVRNAARIIGDSELYTKMEQASQIIKRDIVFATSLYVS